MDDKIKEMIAIGASVTANCIPCIRYHFAKGHEVGLTASEIKDAIKVGRLVRKGAARQWDEEINVLLSEAPLAQNAGCDCA